MKRPQLEHIIRAAAAITSATETVVNRSQSFLGPFPNAPAEPLLSVETDVFTFRDPADADLIDGSIGEGSPFHQTFGYYAHGVAEDTAILPLGWKDRLVRVHNENRGNGSGLCLETHDLAVAKLAAGREKDTGFVAGLLRHKLVNASQLNSRLQQATLTDEHLEMASARLDRLARA
jgi:hypothetical protein